MIYAGGCSMVMGQELVDNDPLNMENKTTAFPAKLQAYNDGWSGSSNGCIINRLYDYVNNNSVDTVIIGWTHWERINAFETGERRLDRLGQWSIKVGVNKQRNDVYAKYFLNESMLKLKYKMQIESTYHWLVANNITPIFFQSLDYVDVKVPMLFNNSWRTQYKQETQDTNLCLHGHPTQQSHDWLAKKIEEKLIVNELYE
tara:strand:- start:2473 stop:3075 length:603 start_codon:yes stop_codon:yes gene_type:complete